MAPKYEVAVAISGTRNGQDWPRPGELIELPEAEAEDYLRVGLVRNPKDAATEETATARRPETATKPARRRGGVKGRGEKAPEKPAEAEKAPEKPAEAEKAPVDPAEAEKAPEGPEGSA